MKTNKPTDEQVERLAIALFETKTGAIGYWFALGEVDKDTWRNVARYVLKNYRRK